MQEKNPWSRERLEKFIGQEETHQLEFKSSKGLLLSDSETDKTFNDLSSHLSAFLNSDGGVLIIGIEESRLDKKQAGKATHLSEGVLRSKWNKDRIQSKLCDRIQPAVASYILVHTVIVGKAEDEDLLAFVIEIKPGNTAYQAADKKYYSRRSSSSEPMEDKDVRLRMLTNNAPRVDLEKNVEVYPKRGSWQNYEEQFENYKSARKRLATRPRLSTEEFNEALMSDSFQTNPDASASRPQKLEKGMVTVQVIAKNTGNVSIKRGCVKYHMPIFANENLKILIHDEKKDCERQFPYALRELDFTLTGEVMLYPEMQKNIFEFNIEFPRSYELENFNANAELIFYLDGGSPANISIDLAELLKNSIEEVNAKALEIESKYTEVKT